MTAFLVCIFGHTTAGFQTAYSRQTRWKGMHWTRRTAHVRMQYYYAENMRLPPRHDDGWRSPQRWTVPTQNSKLQELNYLTLELS